MVTTHLTDVREIESLTALHVVEGYLWCDKHGEVHSDSLNPYGYVNDGKQDYCMPEDHQALFMDSDHNVSPKGEYSGFEAEQFLDANPVPSGLTPGGSCRVQPHAVRSVPVPLTVRRHTDESRAIWRQNLINALPQDMLVEDRFKIADSLLEVTINMGNELRRKRIIDKLMTAAEKLEDLAERNGRNTLTPVELLREWSDLMMDAADEIRSVM